jgi:hypothetical protein
MSEQIQDFLKNHPDLINNPEGIRNCPIKASLTLSEAFLELKKDPTCLGLIIESLSVSNRYKKNKITFKQLKDNLLYNAVPWVTENELNVIEANFFNLNKKISETEINESILWAEIEKVRKSELSKLLENDNQEEIEFNLNDHFKKNNPTLSLFLKKKVLDQTSLEMFGKINSKINQLFSVNKIEQKHYLNENDLIEKDETVFAYINLNKMETPKIPRFGSIFDPYEVHHYKVKNIYHKQIKSKVSFDFGNKKVIVNCDIWVGNIICED